MTPALGLGSNALSRLQRSVTPIVPEFRSFRPLAALLVALTAVYLPWSWSGELSSLGGDSAVYVLSAEHYAPYLPADPVAASIERESQFPPLYPLVLVLAGGARNLHVAHAATTLCLVAAFAAFHALLLAVGLRRGLALATMALFAVMPGTLIQALQLKSEPLYLALSTCGLAVLYRASAAGRSGLYWIATALFGGALLTRSAGFALLPALLIVLLRRRPSGWSLMPVAMLAPALAWSLGREGQENYGQALQVILATPITDAARQLVTNAAAILQGVAASLQPAPAPGAVLAVLGLIAIAATGWRFARLEPDAWYAAAYLAMIVLWPYPSEAQRFGWVLLPLLLASLVWAGEQLARLAAARMPAVQPWLRWLLPGVAGLLVLPGFLQSAQRALQPAARAQPALARLPEWYGTDPAAAAREAGAHLDMARALAELGRQVPAGECIFSIKPVTVAYYARRDGFGPPPPRLEGAAFESWLARPGCRHFLLLAATDGAVFPEPYYPRERMKDRLEILDLRTDADGHVVAALARIRS